MGNEIYQVCSCKDSIENPIKEKVLDYNNLFNIVFIE